MSGPNSKQQNVSVGACLPGTNSAEVRMYQSPSFAGDHFGTQLCALLGLRGSLCDGFLCSRGSCYILAAFRPRYTLSQTPERWLRSCTPTTRFGRPSRWCTRQMVPLTLRWTVPSTRWCTSILWKLLRHVTDYCV